MKCRTLAIILTIIVSLGVIVITISQHDFWEDEKNAILDAQNIATLPEGYYSPAPKMGTLETIDYDATVLFRIYGEKTVSGQYSAGGSKPPEDAEEEDLAKEYTFKDTKGDGDDAGIVISKKATVYLPYGYDPDEQYSVMYLVHGRGGNYKTWLGTSDDPRPFKNILDNMIMKGDIEPIIVVCPELTYYYGLDDRIMDGMSHEISHELMNAVESEYSTYSEGTDPEDFEASRDYRCIAGFSMGGSVTWHLMKDHVEYFRYFMPMSMALYYDRNGYSEEKNNMAVDAIEKNITEKGYTSEDINTYAATGSDDHKAKAIAGQVKLMSSETDLFEYTEKSYTEGNVMLRCWPERWHRYTEAYPYIYDGLIQFFKASETIN